MPPIVRHLTAALLATIALAGTALAGPLDDIKSRGTIQIGLEGTYPPFNYVDEKGKLTGFEIDFAEAVAG